MPKIKPHKGARKRFRVTKNGKVLSTGAGSRHMKASKSPKQRRRLRRSRPLAAPEAKRIKKLLGIM